MFNDAADFTKTSRAGSRIGKIRENGGMRSGGAARGRRGEQFVGGRAGSSGRLTLMRF